LLNDAGKTFAFDHRAISGFARGEGGGAMILKPLDAALRDGDVVRAVIHNSGVNQDGKTNGITVPNGRAQSDLIKQVYAKAGLDPTECGFSECHGTGTKVGDPIEVAGIYEALGAGRGPKNPLFIGSVKSNVGHLEGASGIVSVIKAAMMLEKGMILPNANFEKANPNIPLDQYNMKVSDASLFTTSGHHDSNSSGPYFHQTLATRQEICLSIQLWLRWCKCPYCLGRCSQG
jgi:acyl transferase domain-containing protein